MGTKVGRNEKVDHILGRSTCHLFTTHSLATFCFHRTTTPMPTTRHVHLVVTQHYAVLSVDAIFLLLRHE